jgi:hypothetical protein
MLERKSNGQCKKTPNWWAQQFRACHTRGTVHVLHEPEDWENCKFQPNDIIVCDICDGQAQPFSIEQLAIADFVTISEGRLSRVSSEAPVATVAFRRVIYTYPEKLTSSRSAFFFSSNTYWLSLWLISSSLHVDPQKLTANPDDFSLLLNLASLDFVEFRAHTTDVRAAHEHFNFQRLLDIRFHTLDLRGIQHEQWCGTCRKTTIA